MKRTIRHYSKIFLNLFITLVVVLLVVFVLPKVLLFFMPFVIGWLIALVAHPLVTFIEKRMKIRRRAGSVVVIVTAVVGVALLIYGAVYILIREIMGFAGSVPQMMASIKVAIDKLEVILDRFFVKFPIDPQIDLEQIYDSFIVAATEWTSRQGTPIMNALGNMAKNIPSMLVAVLMCLLSAYFFVAEKDAVTAIVVRHTPKSIKEKWNVIYHSLFGALGGYIKAQFKIEVVMYVIVLIGLWLLKVQHAILIAFVIAFLDLLPVFGTGAVLIPWAIIKLVEGKYTMAVGLMILWSVGQLLRQIIQPKIVGDSIGLAPLPTLFLIYIGWQFGGVVGMLIAVPLGVLLINLIQAGVFHNTRQSMEILLKDFSAFCKYTKEDMEYHKHYLGDEDEKL